MSGVGWSNEEAVARWSAMPRGVLDAMGPEGDFAKRHLVNPDVLRMLGDVEGRRVLDAGCGHGYLARMLAARGARVTGVEPAEGLLAYAREKGRGVRYVRAELARMAEADAGLGGFDAVVCSMVLGAVPEWRPAMAACVRALRPGGRFVFVLNHPAFEGLLTSWREHGAYRTGRYLEEYEITGAHAPDFHRPLSAYLNELAALGCRLAEVAEPGLDPALATADEGLEGYVRLPNFLLVAADREADRE